MEIHVLYIVRPFYAHTWRYLSEPAAHIWAVFLHIWVIPLCSSVRYGLNQESPYMGIKDSGEYPYMDFYIGDVTGCIKGTNPLCKNVYTHVYTETSCDISHGKLRP